MSILASPWRIGDFRNVFKFHAYSVNERLFLTTTKLVRGLSDVATTNVCKVDTSKRNHIERSRWMKWLITGLRQKKCPLIWIHYESPLFKVELSSHPILIFTFIPTYLPVCKGASGNHQGASNHSSHLPMRKCESFKYNMASNVTEKGFASWLKISQALGKWL